jgi:hypothetical protein
MPTLYPDAPTPLSNTQLCNSNMSTCVYTILQEVRSPGGGRMTGGGETAPPHPEHVPSEYQRNITKYNTLYSFIHTKVHNPKKRDAIPKSNIW